MRPLSKRTARLQAEIIEAAQDQDLTLDAQASAAGLSGPAAVGHYKSGRRMPFDHLIAIATVPGVDAIEVLRPLHRELGLVAVRRHADCDTQMTDLVGQVLSAGAGAGDVQRELMSAIADRELTADELDRLRDVVATLRRQVEQLDATLSQAKPGPMAVLG